MSIVKIAITNEDDQILKKIESGLNSKDIKNFHEEDLNLLQKSLATHYGGYATLFDKEHSIYSLGRSKWRYVSPLHSPFFSEKRDRITRALAIKHELYERDEILKNKITPETMQGRILDGRQEVGAHSTLAVLGRESNDVLAMRKRIDFNSSLPMYRNVTGEAKLLKKITGKTYGQDYFNKSDLEKLRSVKPTYKGFHKTEGQSISIGEFANMNPGMTALGIGGLATLGILAIAK